MLLFPNVVSLKVNSPQARSPNISLRRQVSGTRNCHNFIHLRMVKVLIIWYYPPFFSWLAILTSFIITKYLLLWLLIVNFSSLSCTWKLSHHLFEMHHFSGKRIIRGNGNSWKSSTVFINYTNFKINNSHSFQLTAAQTEHNLLWTWKTRNNQWTSEKNRLMN